MMGMAGLGSLYPAELTFFTPSRSATSVTLRY